MYSITEQYENKVVMAWATTFETYKEAESAAFEYIGLARTKIGTVLSIQHRDGWVVDVIRKLGEFTTQAG